SQASPYHTKFIERRREGISCTGRWKQRANRKTREENSPTHTGMKIYTIGFTQKNAKKFFELLKKNNIKQMIDIRLNNTSQLAGFTKKDDLEFFLKELCGINYHHFKFLAPTKEIRDKYNKGKDWNIYTKEYIELLENRKILDELDKSLFEKRTCFLCTEASADHCHRRLLAEYLKGHWKDVEVEHL
ncbi:MAG: DUF488 domain-containing protein, partial [Candidatus Methanoperedens sp.]|nr:DUF488 domain-containing protein [Candidatus Methanoperedens sp.]